MRFEINCLYCDVKQWFLFQPICIIVGTTLVKYLQQTAVGFVLYKLYQVAQ